MTDNEKTYSVFLKELIDDSMSPKRYASYYRSMTDPSLMCDPGSLHTILCLEKKHLSETASNSLEILEHEGNFKPSWIDLKWKLSAYLAVQDVFPSPIIRSRNDLTLFRQWYFYYEAKYILIEAILSGLNGFHAALGLLLRLFLEFSLLQNHLYRKICENNDYSVIDDYFDQKFNPNWSTILNGCLPQNSFCKPIRKRLDIHLKGLSQSSTHPYQPIYSPKHIGAFVPEQSLEGLFFSFKISMILEPVLWMYFVNFPMLFHPVDIEKKFGFNYPVGLFIDEQGATILKKSIPEEDYILFYEYSKNSDDYKNYMDFYNSRENLNHEQILATWDKECKGELDNIIAGHCMQMAELRGLREGMALQSREEPPEIIDTISENLRFCNWRNYYKTLK